MFVLQNRYNEDEFIAIDRASGGYPYLTTMNHCKIFATIKDAQDYNTMNYICDIKRLELKGV